MGDSPWLGTGGLYGRVSLKTTRRMGPWPDARLSRGTCICYRPRPHPKPLAGLEFDSEATWRSGDAADCKSANPGSIPGVASNLRSRGERRPCAVATDPSEALA